MNVNEGRTVASLEVSIIPKSDDLPELNVYNFERVQIAPVGGELKVQETFLFPESLIDETGVDALLKTSYDNNNFVFDPDSLIQTIKVSVRTVETDQTIINNAITQDKVIFNASKGNEFSAIENEKADIIISLSDETIASQTLSENKVQVLQTLRDISYNNLESLENLVSGYRDVTINFVNQDGTETKVFDSSLNSSLPKLLVGKAFQPGDTHVGLNMAINENQITAGDDLIAKVLFTIQTDKVYQIKMINFSYLIKREIL